jgi:general secretion pathway protein G
LPIPFAAAAAAAVPTSIVAAPRRRRRTIGGFTLVELLVVILVIALLAAIIFPVFAQARGKARQACCLSNLRQIGYAVTMYAADSDGLFPYAKDVSDYWVPQIWETPNTPAICLQKLQGMPFLNPTPAPFAADGVLWPYIRDDAVWCCPADDGFDFLDNNDTCNGPCPMNARPTMYERFGASYLYRTEIGMRKLNVDAIVALDPRTGVPIGSSQLLYLFDGNGSWHGSPFIFGRSGLRYDGLFADGHAKFLTDDQYQDGWQAVLGGYGADSLCP